MKMTILKLGAKTSIALLPLFVRVATGADEKNPAANQPKGLSIAELSRSQPVDFQNDILPIFKNNCLACHNQTKAKAELVLETPQTILKGGDSGPAVVPGKSAESLLLKAAAHQTDTPMPPRDNKVNAADLKPEELGLIKLWIDQGAKGEVRAAAPVAWQPLPDGLHPILAVAVTSDGQFAACGRGNQIFIYHLPSKQLVTRLTDPELIRTGLYREPGVAHRDMVHSLAFSPDGNLLASGDYRQAKLWRRPRDVQKLSVAGTSGPTAQALAVSPDGKWLAFARDEKTIKLLALSDGKDAKLLTGHEKTVTSLKFSPDSTKLVSGADDKTIRVWDVREGELFAQGIGPAEVRAVAWLTDGKRIAAGGTDNSIRLWTMPEAGRGELVSAKELKGHEGAVTSLETIPTAANEILSGSADGSVRHWNIETGKAIREMKHGTPVTFVAVRGDGKRFASAGHSSAAKLWDTENGKLIADLKGDRYASELVATTERELSFAGSEINYRKSSIQNAEKEHKTQVDRIKKATEAQQAAAKACDEKKKALDSATEAKTAADKALAELNAEIKTVTDQYQAAEKAAQKAAADAKAALDRALQIKIPADEAAETKALSQKVAADAAAVATKTKDAASNQSEGEAKGAAKKIAADADSVAARAKTVAAKVAQDADAKAQAVAQAQTLVEKAVEEAAAKAFAQGQLKPRFDQITKEGPDRKKQAEERMTATTKARDDADKEFKKTEIAKSAAEHELELAKNAEKLAVEAVAAAKSALQLAEETQKKVDAELKNAKEAAAQAERTIRAVAFSTDHLALATSGDDTLIHTWSADTGAPFETFRGHKAPVAALTFTKAGELCSASPDPGVLVLDLDPEWKLERVLGTSDANSPLADRVHALRFSPDAQRLATGSGEPTRGGEIKLWAVSTGHLLQDLKTVHSDMVFSLDFTADAKYLASGAADKFVRVVDLATGKVARSFEGHTHHVLGVSWKRDGRTLMSAGADNVIKVWDFLTGERKKNIDGFNKEVTAISFIGITDQAVASSGDNQVRIVKDNGDKGRSFDGVSDFMYAVAVTPDGKTVIAGGQDGVLRVWNGTDGKALANFSPPDAGAKLAEASAVTK
jgi:WD40 repeat protein